MTASPQPAPPEDRAPRELVGAIIGAEAGAAAGLLAIGATPLVPLALAALGAAIGAGSVHARRVLIRRWLRVQLRAAREATD